MNVFAKIANSFTVKRPTHQFEGRTVPLPPKGGSSVQRNVHEPKIHIDSDITEESAERIAEALREHFGDTIPSAASIRELGACSIDYDPEEYSTIRGVAFADYDVFERRLQLLDRLITMQSGDSFYSYIDEINMVVKALMQDCDVIDPSDFTEDKSDDDQ